MATTCFEVTFLFIELFPRILPPSGGTFIRILACFSGDVKTSKVFWRSLFIEIIRTLWYNFNTCIEKTKDTRHEVHKDVRFPK